MPRTRGQEVALQERGLPTTPPQQLPTPRRTQKPKVGSRKTKQLVAVPSRTSPLPQTNSHTTRTRSTITSQTDTQVLQPVRTAVQKRGQKKSKFKKVTQSIDEEVIGKEAPEFKVLQELSENSNSQAVQPVARENPHISSIIPVVPFPSLNVQTPLSLSGTIQPPEKTNSITKREACTSATSAPEDGTAHVEPGLLETDLILPPSEHAQEQKLIDVISNSIPSFIALLQKHPEIEGNAALERILMERDLSVTMKPVEHNKARLGPRPEEQTPHVSDDVLESPRHSPKSASRLLLKRKIDEREQDDIGDVASKRLRTGSSQTKRVPQLFDKDGMLSLTAYKEVPIEEGSSSEEEVSDATGQPSQGASSQSERRLEHSPATPQPRGWALSGLLPSAQTVSRFLPSFSRLTPAVTPVPITLPSSATDTSQTENHPLVVPNNEPTAPVEPRSFTSDGKENEGLGETHRNSRRHRHPKSKRALKAKNEKDEIRKRDEMIASLQAQLEMQSKGQVKEEDQTRNATYADKAGQATNATLSTRSSPAHSELDAQTQAGCHALTTNVTVQTPKSILKRKATSPNVIPNPPGGGIGLVLEYFGQDSDSDDDNADNTCESKSPSGPPRKKISLGAEPATLYNGDRFRATPYLGKELALPPLPSEISYSRNTFLDTNLDAECQISTDTPPNGPTVTIRVPSPSDSDSEWDGTSYVDRSDDLSVTPSALASALTRIDDNAQTSGREGLGKQHVPDNNPSQEPVPYENPNVNPAFDFCGSLSKPKSASELAFPTTWTYPAPSIPQAPSIIGSPNLALDKARQSALKHKPQQPSRLRETARFSTSSVGTEVDDNEVKTKNKVTDDAESRAESRKTASEVTECDQNGEANKAALGSTLPKRNIFNDAELPQDLDARDPWAGRTMRQSPHDPMLLEPVPLPGEPLPGIDQSPELSGEISTDTTTSDEDLSDNLPVFDSYAKVQSLLAPRLREHLHHDLDNDENTTQIENAPASDLRGEARVKFDEHIEEYFDSQKEKLQKFLGHKAKMSEIGNIPRNIRDQMVNGWKATDREAAVKKLDTEFEDYLDQLM